MKILKNLLIGILTLSMVFLIVACDSGKKRSSHANQYGVQIASQKEKMLRQQMAEQQRRKRMEMEMMRKQQKDALFMQYWQTLLNEPQRKTALMISAIGAGSQVLQNILDNMRYGDSYHVASKDGVDSIYTKDPEFYASLIQRAEKSGAEVIVDSSGKIVRVKENGRTFCVLYVTEEVYEIVRQDIQ
ncbi:MAG: hypothetical protein ABIA04_06745 [Pseudomonadota bacterium]